MPTTKPSGGASKGSMRVSVVIPTRGRPELYGARWRVSLRRLIAISKSS
jgi:hypothetical protein